MCLTTECKAGSNTVTVRLTPKDSTLYQVISVYDDFCKSFDSEVTTPAIFLDTSKAFSKVYMAPWLTTEIACFCLFVCFLIRGTLLNQFLYYLAESKQAVVLHGSISDYFTLPAGALQGSVLGPVLFPIRIHDIVEDVESIIQLSTDDTSMLTASCSRTDHVCPYLHEGENTLLKPVPPAKQASDVNRRATLDPLLCQLGPGGDAPGVQGHWRGQGHDGMPCE